MNNRYKDGIIPVIDGLNDNVRVVPVDQFVQLVKQNLGPK